MPAGVRGLLEQVRGRWLSVTRATAGLRLGGLVLGWVSAQLLLDYLLVLPVWGRGVVLLLLGATILAGIWRWWLVPLRGVPGTEELALLVERRQPGLRSRLISSVQLNASAADSGLGVAYIERLRGSISEWGGAVDPAVIVPDTVVRRWRKRLVFAVGVFGLVFVVSWPWSGVLVRRALLQDIAIPTRTRVVSIESPAVVGRGDDVRIRVRVEGHVPRAGRLWVLQESGRTVEYALDADAEQGRGWFSRTLTGVPAGFRFRVRVHDAESEERRVEVVPRPVVTDLRLIQVLPEYTGVAAREVKPGELTLLRGSRLRVEARASQALSEARIRAEGLDRTVALGLADEGRRLEGELVVEDDRLHGFSIELRDRQGIESRDSAVYAVHVVEDRVPGVRVTVPARREELVTPKGTVLVAIEAKDDFGIGKLRLRHQAAGSTNGAAESIELDLSGERPMEVRRRFEWRLSTLQPPLKEGVLHEFWVEAEDLNTVSKGSRVGRSDSFLLRVVTDAEKRADLLGRAGDVIARLGEVAQGQERLNESLGRIILTRPPPQSGVRP